MLTHVGRFWVPKIGCSEGDYEDALWVGPDGSGSGDLSLPLLRVAVSDGASESMLASRWARRLVEAFGLASMGTRTKEGFAEAYRSAVEGWDDVVREYTADRDERGTPIQWFEEPGLAKGASATILVVEFEDGHDGTDPCWRAAAIGDSCLFQVRDEALIESFPMTEAAAFNYQPPLLPSRGTDEVILQRHLVRRSGDWEHGDHFYLVTDALAAWFLQVSEIRLEPWQSLRDLGTSDGVDFRAWVDERRALGEMHDDDTTLVRVDIF